MLPLGDVARLGHATFLGEELAVHASHQLEEGAESASARDLGLVGHVGSRRFGHGCDVYFAAPKTGARFSKPAFTASA